MKVIEDKVKLARHFSESSSQLDVESWAVSPHQWAPRKTQEIASLEVHGRIHSTMRRTRIVRLSFVTRQCTRRQFRSAVVSSC